MEVKEIAKFDQSPPMIKLCKSKRSQTKKNIPEIIAVKAAKEINGPLLRENDTPPIEAKTMKRNNTGFNITSIQATGLSRMIFPEAKENKNEIK